MSFRHRLPSPAQTPGPTQPPYGSNRSRNPVQDTSEEPYNIIPIHNPRYPSLRYPEVRAANAALRDVGELRKPLFVQWREEMDLLDWLGAFFGFQRDNVRNQREHLVLHLANAQMRLQPPPDNIDSLDPGVLRRFRCKLLKNYTSWCSYLGRQSNVWISESARPDSDSRRELLYASLYLLIWGESANLRFAPECICYIFHHMAMELNRILENYIDENTGRPAQPSISGENAFLNRVVKPIYDTISAEVENSKNGTAPHTAWRNYDDINEYFWSKRCFEKLKWPFDLDSSFFVTTSTSQGRRVGKTGFVEQRSFWNLFRSFDRLWLMLILFLQASIIIAWDQEKYSWQAWGREEVLIRILSVFLTWSGLRFLQSLLDAGMQYRLVSRETLTHGVRLVLKIIVSAGWIIIFSVFYSRILRQKRLGRQARNSIVNFLKVVVVFLIPEIIEVVFFIIPWIRNLAENKNWRIFYLLTWWFQSLTFVGRGLREGLIDTIKYSLFWIVVLVTKFAFSYFLQVKPMIIQTKELLNLENVNYKWHQFFKSSNRLAVGLLWLPVVLIYLLDLQIWYSIYSSLVGGFIGILEHIGEIQNMQHFRWRFQLFASAIQLNLMPEEEQLQNTMGTLKSKFRDAINRLKLSFGFGSALKKLKSNQIEAHKFALIWNEIITVFREEDVISDRELELLELPPNTWNVRVIHWPCVLLCNELLLALDQARKLEDAPDKWIWYKMCKTEYRSCAIIEAYDSIRHLLLHIVKQNTEEHSIITIFFQTIDNSIQIEKFTKMFNLKAMPQIHGKLKSLLEILVKSEKDVSKVVNILQALYEEAVRDFYKGVGSIDQLREDGLAPRNPDSSSEGGLLFENAVALPDSVNEAFYRQVRRLHTLISSHDTMHTIPTNLEARRRIAFFSNSLFMNIPRAPHVQNMMAFSVLTPYYNEEVLYSKEKLLNENEDGISTLYYLQTIYPDEWKNFMERMRREGMANDNEIYAERITDLRLWASFRGQTLSRTVRGMMYYYRALKMLAFLDSTSEMGIREGSRGLASGALRNGSIDRFRSEWHPSTRSLSRTDTAVSMLFKGHEHGDAIMKYTYVVSCQIYGSQKANKDPGAEEILYLMKTNEALRVAYVDEVSSASGRDEKEYYSVLVKYDQELEREVEIYRVKLPGPLKLGEGKPENQNHALIFTRGDAVQTIDMNQDNYFEEALKMRNLLEEYKRPYGIRKPTLLGVREHIFTGSVSSLAWFMSVQETGFVTLWQRVLANPLKVRMHYGHPDVFDRFWFLTRGGISKASRVINISEDVFAGFNCTLRGGNVTHHEYIQVGKGRYVGFNQISMFEKKVASGNGEQALSRDVYRLGHRLDFFRMLSFFFTTVGFFFNIQMVILTVYAFLWGRLYQALSGLEAYVKYTKNNKAPATILYQQFIVQLGVFTVLPMIAESFLEQGFLGTFWDFIPMNLQLTSVFFTFSMGTRAHNFGRTILHGGAKYRAAGHGYVVQHMSFAENYRLYARSHFVKAIELGLILIVYACYSPIARGTLAHIASTITSWYLVVSWIMAPFVFNPSGFDWLKNVYDFDDFMTWIWYRGGVLSKPEQCWEKWWLEEQDHLRTTGLFGKVVEIVLNLRFFFFQYGIVYQLGISNHSKSVAVYLLSWIFVGLAIGVYFVIVRAHNRYAAKSHLYYRFVNFLFFISGVPFIFMLLEFTHFKFLDVLTSLLLLLPTGWGLILMAQVFRPAIQNSIMWEIVVSVARQYEIMFGVIVFAPVAILSWTPGLQTMQTRTLFNEAFSRGLHISQILKGKKSHR